MAGFRIDFASWLTRLKRSQRRIALRRRQRLYSRRYLPERRLRGHFELPKPFTGWAVDWHVWPPRLSEAAVNAAVAGFVSIDGYLGRGPSLQVEVRVLADGTILRHMAWPEDIKAVGPLP